MKPYENADISDTTEDNKLDPPSESMPSREREMPAKLNTVNPLYLAFLYPKCITDLQVVNYIVVTCLANASSTQGFGSHVKPAWKQKS